MKSLITDHNCHHAKDPVRQQSLDRAVNSRMICAGELKLGDLCDHCRHAEHWMRTYERPLRGDFNVDGDVPGKNLWSQYVFWFSELLVGFGSTSEIECAIDKDLRIEMAIGSGHCVFTWKSMFFTVWHTDAPINPPALSPATPTLVFSSPPTHRIAIREDDAAALSPTEINFMSKNISSHFTRIIKPEWEFMLRRETILHGNPGGFRSTRT